MCRVLKLVSSMIDKSLIWLRNLRMERPCGREQPIQTSRSILAAHLKPLPNQITFLERLFSNFKSNITPCCMSTSIQDLGKNCPEIAKSFWDPTKAPKTPQRLPKSLPRHSNDPPRPISSLFFIQHRCSKKQFPIYRESEAKGSLPIRSAAACLQQVHSMLKTFLCISCQ